MKQLFQLLLFALTFLVLTSLTASNGIVFHDGLYYTNSDQTSLYTGEYKEYYDNGSLKLELNIKDGKPTGVYVIYYPSGKPQEIRNYKNGNLHDVCRNYNEAGKIVRAHV